MNYTHALLAMGASILEDIDRNINSQRREAGTDSDGFRIPIEFILHLANMGIIHHNPEYYTKLWYQWKFKNILCKYNTIKYICRLFLINKQNKVGLMNLKLQTIC